MFESLKREKWIFYFEGALLLLLGFLAIILPQITTISLGIMVSVFLIIAGVIMILRTFRMENRKVFWSSLLAGGIAVIIGLLMLGNLNAGIYALTLLLIAFLCFEGILKIILATALRPLKNWGYLLFSGIAALILAFLIIVGLPVTAFVALGLIFGIYLLLAGFSTIAFGIGLEKKPETASS